MSDGGFATPYDPTQSAMVQWLLQIGGPEMAQLLAPMLNPMQQASYAGMAPLAEDAGTTGATNYFQDLNQLTADNVTAAMAGAGAYSEGAFDPIQTTTVVPTPGRARLQQLAMNPTSLEGLIARHILEGGSASTAYAEINRIVGEAQEAGDEATPEQLLVLNQIPIDTNEVSGAEIVDTDYVTDLAQGMQDEYLADNELLGAGDAGAERMWVTGPDGSEQLVEITSTPSEAAQWYTDRGLSLPTDTYSAESLLGNEWAAQDQQYWSDVDPVLQALRQQMLDTEAREVTAAREAEINVHPMAGMGGPTSGGGPTAAEMVDPGLPTMSGPEPWEAGYVAPTPQLTGGTSPMMGDQYVLGGSAPPSGPPSAPGAPDTGYGTTSPWYTEPAPPPPIVPNLTPGAPSQGLIQNMLQQILTPPPPTQGPTNPIGQAVLSAAGQPPAPASPAQVWTNWLAQMQAQQAGPAPGTLTSASQLPASEQMGQSTGQAAVQTERALSGSPTSMVPPGSPAAQGVIDRIVLGNTGNPAGSGGGDSGGGGSLQFNPNPAVAEAVEEVRRRKRARTSEAGQAYQSASKAASAERDRIYDYDYGKAAFISYLLNRAGIRPLDRELAARQTPLAAAGIKPD